MGKLLIFTQISTLNKQKQKIQAALYRRRPSKIAQCSFWRDKKGGTTKPFIQSFFPKPPSPHHFFLFGKNNPPPPPSRKRSLSVSDAIVRVFPNPHIKSSHFRQKKTKTCRSFPPHLLQRKREVTPVPILTQLSLSLSLSIIQIHKEPFLFFLDFLICYLLGSL